MSRRLHVALIGACLAMTGCSPAPLAPVSAPRVRSWEAKALPIPQLPTASERATRLPSMPAPSPAVSYADPAQFVVDASSPEAMVNSLRLAEQQLSPQNLALVRLGLSSYDVEISQKIYGMAQKAGPGFQLDDKKLFAIAYGDLHGQSLATLIQRGRGRALEIAQAKGRPGPVAPQ